MTMQISLEQAVAFCDGGRMVLQTFGPEALEHWETRRAGLLVDLVIGRSSHEHAEDGVDEFNELEVDDERS